MTPREFRNPHVAGGASCAPESGPASGRDRMSPMMTSEDYLYYMYIFIVKYNINSYIIYILKNKDKEPVMWESGHPRRQILTNVRFRPSIKSALDKAAKDQGVSRNELINSIISDYLKLDL